MKIALIGYGKMGRMVEQIALNRGHQIVARISSGSWKESEIAKADLCIEFTSPAHAVENISKIADLGKPIVVGTTDWYHHIPKVAEIVDKKNIAVLYGPNFSIGVFLLLQTLSKMAAMIGRFEEYDVAGIEYHHREKKDAPSGTAKLIAKTVEEVMPQVDKVDFAHVRCGYHPGKHEVIFDSSCDTLTIGHEARDRTGFAVGAVKAGEWVLDKKGIYTFNDYMLELIGGL